MPSLALPVGSFFIPSTAVGTPGSSSTSPAPSSPLLNKVRELAEQLPVELEAVPAFRSTASLSDVDGQIFRVSIVPDVDRVAPAATPTDDARGKGKAKAPGKRQLQRNDKSRGVLLAEVLVGLSRSASLWRGEVALDAEGQVLGAEPTMDAAVAWDGRSLQQLYSSMPSPIPSSVTPFAPVGSQEFKALAQVLDGVDKHLPGMRTTLFKYQVTDVKQMVLCELANPQLADLAFIPMRAVPVHSYEPAADYFVSLATGLVRSTVDRFAAPRGGVLCEEMGFGKTVCIFALILATKSQRAGAPEDLPIQTPWVRSDAADGQRVLPLIDLAAHRLLSTPFQAIHPATFDDPDVLPPDALDVLQALNFRAHLPYYWAPAKETRGRSGANRIRKVVPVWLGWGSLVLVPGNLLVQWKAMLAKHVEPGALRALILEGNDLIPPAEVLARDYDLVLMSHERFSRESERNGFDSGATTSRPCHCRIGSKDEEECMCTSPPSPLVRVRWKRLVVDEGHVASSKTSGLVMLSSLLPAERVWCVSGTPTPNLVGLSKDYTDVAPAARPWPKRFEKDVARLHALCTFLRVGSFSSDSTQANKLWSSLVAAPLRIGGSDTPEPGAVHRLDVLLQRIMIRHLSADRSDAVLPPLHVSSVSVAPTSQTVTTNNVLLAIMSLNSLTTGRTGDAYLFHPKSASSLSRLYSNLSYAAFWLSSPTFFDVISKRWAVNTEVDETDKGNRPYDADDRLLLRDTFLHLERGSDLLWQQAVGSFGASLPARVCGLDDHLAQAWGASRPSGWKDHLMLPAKLVTLRRLATSYLRNHPDVDSSELMGYLILEGEAEQSEEARAAKRREEHALGKRTSAAWWNSEAQNESQRMSKAKQRALASNDPFPSTPPVPPDFSLLNARVVSTFSSKLNYIISQVLRFGADEKTLIFSRDASALGLLIEALDLVGVPADFVGGLMSVADRQKTFASFQDGERVRVLLIELTQGSRGLDLSSASRVIFCEPVDTADVEMQAIKRAHRVGQTKDVYVETLVARGTFEEQIIRKKPSHRTPVKATVSKGLPPDSRVAEVLRSTPFLLADQQDTYVGPSFDVPLWLSGTHHQTMQKLRSGSSLVRVQATAPLANNSLRSLAPVRRAEEDGSAQRRNASRADLVLQPENGAKRVRVR